MATTPRSLLVLLLAATTAASLLTLRGLSGSEGSLSEPAPQVSAPVDIAGPAFVAALMPDGVDVRRTLGAPAVLTRRAEDQLCLSVMLTDLRAPAMAHLHSPAAPAVRLAVELEPALAASNARCTAIERTVLDNLIADPTALQVEARIAQFPEVILSGRFTRCDGACSM